MDDVLRGKKKSYMHAGVGPATLIKMNANSQVERGRELLDTFFY
jgi:hypothetical protein